MEQRPKVVRDIVLTCVVLQGGADRPPTPANDIQPPQADQREQGHNEIFRNPLREAKHQRDLLKDYFNHPWGTGWAGGQSLRIPSLIQELLFSKVLTKK